MSKYLLLDLVFAGLAAGLVLAVQKGLQPWRRYVRPLAGLLALTAVFDPLIVHFDIVRYQPDAVLGLHWFGAPLEDFAYAIVAAVLLPVLWRWALALPKGWLGTLFVSSRPVSWVNTAYPFAAGYVLATHSWDARLIVGSLYFLVPYNLLMYGVNDVFDYESDLRNPRKGGVDGAKLPKRLHPLVLKAAAVSNLPFLAYLLWAGTPSSAAVVAVLICTVVAYSAPGLRFKERPVLDSITSSCHFVGPLLFALVLTGWQAHYWPYLVAFFCWGMASHAFGAVQDIKPDRQGGIASIATVFGARATVWLSLALYAACGLLLLRQGWPVALLGLCAAAYIANIAPFATLSDQQSSRAQAGWRRFLYLNYFTGFVVTILLILHLRHI